MSAEADTQVPEDQDLVINLDEPPPQEASSGGTKPPPVPGPPGATPQVALVELEKQVEAERRERARITQAANQLAHERNQAVAYARDAEQRGVNNYEQQVDNYIQNGHDQVEAMTGQYAAALDAGNIREAADINRKMGRINAQIAVLERDKAVWMQQREQQAAMAKRAPPVQQQAPRQPTDPVERAISGRTEPTKAFLRKHTDLIRSDGTLKRLAIEAHEKALDAGMTVDTDSYFRHIEQTLNGSKEQGGTQMRAPQGAPTMAAPISRNSGPGSGGGNGTFVMSPKMRRLADEQGVTPHEWASNYVRLLKEGKITPIT